jgi:uncharacterized repeat protein (TIGR01451 family)
MKFSRMWTLAAVTGTGLLATLLGQAVLGQQQAGPMPDLPPGVLPPPTVVQRPSTPYAEPSRPNLVQPQGVGIGSLPPPVPLQAQPLGKPTPMPLVIPGADAQPGGAPQPFQPINGPQITNTTPPPPPSPFALPALNSGGSDLGKNDKSSVPNVVPAPSPNEQRAGRVQPSVSVEWVGPQSARLNQPIACQLLVRNHSNAPVQNVVVRHRLPSGVTCKASEPQATLEQGELVWTLGAMAPEQTKRIDVQMLSTVRGALNCQATVTFSVTSAMQVQVREPQLAVKMRAPDKVVAGEEVTLLFAVTNPGDGTAEKVKLKAILPEGLEHKNGRIIEADVGELPPKQIQTMQLQCIAKGSGPQKCMAIAVGENGISATDNTTIDILLPKLDLAMTGPKLRFLDRRATYVMKVTNPGSAPANAVALQEVVPAGFKFHSATQGGQFDEGSRTVVWALGDLLPGQVREVAIDLIPIVPGDHKLAALVTTTRGLKTEAEVRTKVEGVSSLMIELVDLDDPVEVGAETAYQLRITNTGTKTETNLQVNCTLPDQVQLISAKCGAGNINPRTEGRELIFDALPRLAPKADVIYQIQVRGKTPGNARFRVHVRADGLSEPVQREENTRFYSDDAPATRPATPAAAPTSPVTPPVTAPSQPPVAPLPTSPLELPPLQQPQLQQPR